MALNRTSGHDVGLAQILAADPQLGKISGPKVTSALHYAEPGLLPLQASFRASVPHPIVLLYVHGRPPIQQEVESFQQS